MSRENVEIVRRMLATYSTGDSEEWLGYWAHDAEWTAVVFSAVEGQDRVYRGYSGLRRFRADQLEVFAEVRVDATDFRDVGDLVVVLGELTGRGATSGASFARPLAWLFELQDRKIVRGQDYLDHRTALEAAGLPA
jgi:ketosteroid isomerase-like protein